MTNVTGVTTARRIDPEYFGRSLAVRRTWYGNEGSDTPPETPNTDTPTVDWTKIDPTTIPVDVLKRSPEYTRVLEESIARRKLIADLRSQVTKDDPQPETPKPTPPVTDVNPEIKEALDFIKELRKQQSEQSAIDLRRKAAAEVGLEPDDHEVLKGSTYDELVASGRQFVKRFGLGSGRVGDGGQAPIDTMRTRLVERMKSGGSNPDDIFDPAFQRSKGGGTPNNS